MYISCYIINYILFYHQVPAAKEMSEEELLKLLETDDPTGYRIPMSIGEPHAELDKCKCTVLMGH